MKKFLSLVLAVTMTLSLSTAYFSDLEGHWAKDVMEQANSNGLIYGDNGKMNPDALLTRAQMATILVRALGLNAFTDMEAFTDVKQDDWFYSEIETAVAMGMLQGSGNKLMPNNYVTREQAFVVVARAISLPNGFTDDLRVFSDYSQISGWAQPPLAKMVSRGYATGSNGKLNPQKNMTRAEFAALLAKVFPNIVSSSNQTSFKAGNILLNNPNYSIGSTFIENNVIIGGKIETANLSGIGISGDLIICGGGDTLTLSNSTNVTGQMIVRSSALCCRIRNTSMLAIPTTEVYSNTLLMGKFNTVYANADVGVMDGVVQSIYVHKAGTTVRLHGGGIANYIYVTADDVVIEAPSGVSNIILSDGVGRVLVNGSYLTGSIVSNAQ